MRAQEFYDAVSERVESDPEETTAAVLTTLGARVTDGAASDLAADLPDEVGAELEEGVPGEASDDDLEEFLADVADREDVPMDEARERARAVLGTATDAASAEAVEPVTDQLPDEFARVLEPGEQATREEFLGTVRENSDEDLSDEAAADAATATLRTLGERLSKGEATDLATYLPPAFGDALVAGAPQEPASFPAEEFLDRVADHLDVDQETAEERATAVLDAVATTAGNTEVDAAMSQLPQEYDRLFAT